MSSVEYAARPAMAQGLDRRVPAPTDADPRTQLPTWLFAVEVGYLLALLAAGLVYLYAAPVRVVVDAPIGDFPLAVPFFGALGAVMISLQGMVAHSTDWDPRFERWHLLRPLTGIVVGLVSYLVLSSVVAVATATPPGTTGGGPVLYALTAFLVGYREQTFRELLERAGDLILGTYRNPDPRRSRP